MLIGALIRSYGLTNYLTAVLDSYSWVDKIVVMNYKFNGVKPIKDDTPLLTAPFKNAILKSGEGLNQHEVLNLGLDELKGFDCIFIADNDELITRADQNRIVEATKEYGGTCCEVIDYARDFQHIFPIRGHRPITSIRDGRFYDVRCASGSHKFVENAYVHHFGFVHSKEELEWKFDWERPWEHNETIRIFSQIPRLYEMPEEIKELLSDKNT